MSDRSLGESAIRDEHGCYILSDKVIAPIVSQIQEGLDGLH